MNGAIGQILPLAVAVALSPIPIIGVILMLGSPRARVDGPMFVLGWVVGLAAVGAIALSVAGTAGASDDGAQSTGTNWVLVALGALLIVLAGRQWRGRPKAGETPEMPKWMNAIDSFSPGKSFGFGVLLSALNPKNLILAIGAAASIAATDISGAQQAIAYGVFTIIGTSTVFALVVIYFAMGERSTKLLDGLKTWMAEHNAAIMTVLLLLIGAKLVGQGIGGF